MSHEKKKTQKREVTLINLYLQKNLIVNIIQQKYFHDYISTYSLGKYNYCEMVTTPVETVEATKVRHPLEMD